MAIKGEIVDAKSIRDVDTDKRKESQPSSSLKSDRGLLFPEDHRDRTEAIKA